MGGRSQKDPHSDHKTANYGGEVPALHFLGMRTRSQRSGGRARLPPHDTAVGCESQIRCVQTSTRKQRPGSVKGQVLYAPTCGRTRQRSECSLMDRATGLCDTWGQCAGVPSEPARPVSPVGERPHEVRADIYRWSFSPLRRPKTDLRVGNRARHEVTVAPSHPGVAEGAVAQRVDVRLGCCPTPCVGNGPRALSGNRTCPTQRTDHARSRGWSSSGPRCSSGDRSDRANGGSRRPAFHGKWTVAFSAQSGEF